MSETFLQPAPAAEVRQTHFGSGSEPHFGFGEEGFSGGSETRTTLRRSPESLKKTGRRSSNEEEFSDDHDHMRGKCFLGELGWSSLSASLGAHLQRTMTTCVGSLLGGDLGHGHRLFVSNALLT